MGPAPPAAHKAPAKNPTPSAESVPREGTHVEGVGETTPLPAERFAPSEGVIPSAVVQTKITPPILPLVISSSDPFADISQAAKGSALLVVTPSSIPGSATCGPDLDLSSEGSADIFEDPDDVPVLKRTISDSDEEGSASSEPDLMGMYLPSPLFPFFFLYLCFVCILISPLAETSKGPEIAASVGMTAPTSPVAPVPAAPSVPVSAVPTAPAPSVPVVPLPTTPVAPIPGNFGTLSFSFLLHPPSFFSFASLFFPRHLFLFFFFIFPCVPLPLYCRSASYYSFSV